MEVMFWVSFAPPQASVKWGSNFELDQFLIEKEKIYEGLEYFLGKHSA